MYAESKIILELKFSKKRNDSNQHLKKKKKIDDHQYGICQRAVFHETKLSGVLAWEQNRFSI